MTLKKKLLVIGAQGFVAGSVLAQVGPEWEVHAISRTEPQARSLQFSWHTCDPLREDQLATLFHAIRPDALIHTAAVADIDFAEMHQNLARAVNVEMTRALVALVS